MVAKPPSTDPVTDALVGSIIGDRYRIDSLVDQGAMGRVFSAHHVRMRKRVAVKVLRPELTRVPEVMARFEREAMAAANINHPHVATATDFGKLEDGSVYLVLEFVEGRTLRALIRQGPLPVDRALRIAGQMASGLSAAHAIDIVHRDLKPENVMLVEQPDGSDFVKVLDFGVAKVPIDLVDVGQAEAKQPGQLEGSVVTQAGMVFGTPDYMPPEQALGQQVDARADLYALGVILYEMLTGVRPFQSEHDFGIIGQQLSGGAPPMSHRAPEATVPVEVEEFVRQLLVNEINQRVQTAQECNLRIKRLLRKVGNPSILPGPDEFAALRPQARSLKGADELDDAVTIPRLASSAVVPPAKRRERSFGWSGPVRRWRSFGGWVKRVLEALGPSLRQWIQPLQRQVERLPGQWRLGVWLPLAGAALILVGFLVVLTRGRLDAEPSLATTPHPVTSAAGEVATTSDHGTATKPTEEQISRALEEGGSRLDTLLERFPDDPQVHVVAARFALKNKEYSRALRSVEQALELEPELTRNKYVAGILWDTAQRSSTSKAAFKLLTGSMEAAGADIVLDLALTSGVPRAVQLQARRWLRSKTFAQVSTPEANIAAALLLAPSCKVRQGLLKRAQNVGDERCLPLLERFASGKGCGTKEPEPCNACIDGTALEEAMAAIKQRESQRQAAKD